MDWQRKRHPEDVPTPVAVALSDFCRRAKSPASPGLVRDALALLGAEDDARVQQLAEGDPQAKVGPFGVVDVVLGTDWDTAATRQTSGFYDQVRAESQKSALPELLEQSVAPVAATKGPSPQPSPRSAGRGRAKSIKSRIAPVKRRAGEEVKREAPKQPLPGTAFLPKRNLPAPRGRFSTIDPERASFESLFRPDAKATLTTLVGQVPHRVALLRTIEQGYASRRGTPLSVGDVEDLLEAHDLFSIIETKERDGVLAQLLEQKGSLGGAARELGLKSSDLESLIGALGLTRETDEIRERFIKEALDARNLANRLDLVFRSRYLEDLKIDRRFTTTLTKELTALIDEVKANAPTVPALVDLISRAHALNPDSLRRALDKLGLLKPWLD